MSSIRVGATLLIHPTDAPCLARALHRALVAGIASDYWEHYTTFHDDGSIDQLLVTSSSQEGLQHPVTVIVRGRAVFVACKCKAGRSGALCQHISYALHLMGFEQPLITQPLRERQAA